MIGTMPLLRSFAQPFAFTFILIGLLVFNACTVPLVVDYQPFHYRSFSKRNAPANRHDGSTEDLLLGGYLLIGYIDVRQNIRKCWETDKCNDILEGGPSDEQLALAAAARGGDAITWLQGETNLEPVQYSYCTNYTYTTVTIKGKTSTIKVCNSYTHVKGFMEYRVDRALIWRLEPELATAEANQKAIEKAMHRMVRDSGQTKTQGATEDHERPAQPLASAAIDMESDVKGIDVPETVRQMLVAIRSGDQATIRQLASRPVVNAWSDDKGRSILVQAVASGYHEAVSAMIENGFQWQTLDDQGYAAIEYMAALGTVESLKTALKHGGAVTFKSKEGRNLLFSAVENTDPSVLIWLLDQGVDPNARDANGICALMTAIHLGKTKSTELLMARNAKLSGTDNEGRTLLMTAAGAGHTELIELLLSKGSNVHKRDHKGNSAIIYAAGSGQNRAIDKLLDRGAHLDDRNHKGITPFAAAWITKNWATVVHLLDKPKIIDNVKQYGPKLLKAAIKEDAAGVVYALLAKLPEDVVQDDVNEIFDEALAAGKKEVAQALVLCGADINRRSGRGLTRLMQAAEHGSGDEVAILLELGADTEVEDFRGRTALMIATTSGKVDIVRRLRQHGAKK